MTPENGGIPITSYTVYWNGLNPTSNVYTILSIVDANTNTIQATPVNSGTTYKFKVLATNDVGDGPLSSALAVKAAM